MSRWTRVPSACSRRRFAALALAVGLALALVVGWPVLGGRVPFPADVVYAFPPWAPAGVPELVVPPHGELGDVAVQMYAWRLLAQRSFADGHLPLWNPHSLLGTPQLANGQSAVFWPPNWLDPVLPLPWSWTLGMLLETALTFLSTALLARELGCRASGALLAATAFTLSGQLVAWSLWPLGDGARCLPFVLYAVLRLDRRPGPATVALAGLALSLPMLAGHPQMAFYDWMAGAALAGFLAVRPRAAEDPPRARRLAAAAGAAALGAALAAAQWLPTWEWIGHLVRPLDETWERKLPASHLVAWLSRDLRANPNPVGIEVPEGAAYVGLATLLLASMAALRPRRASVAFWIGLGAIGAAIAYAVRPFVDLANSLPVLRALPNQRLLIWPDFALALLAGIGLTALLEPADPPARRRRRWTAAISLAGCFAALGWASLRATPEAFAGPRGLATTWALALASAVGLACLVLASERPRRVAAWGLALLVALDLGQVASGHVPMVEAQAIFPAAPVLEVLQRRLEVHAAAGQRFRVGFLDHVVPPNTGVAYGIDTVEGYEYVTRSSAALLAPVTGGVGWNDHTRVTPRALAHGPLLELLAVRYLVAVRGSEQHAALAGDRQLREVRTGGRTVVYERRGALPGAALIPWSGLQVERDPEATLRALTSPDFDPRRSALVAEPPARPRAGPHERRERVSPSRLAVERLGSGYRVRLAAPGRSLLVLAEQAYPGWRVRVDGRPRPLVVVDHALQGVAIPRGAHTVEFTFEPASVRWGLRISGLAAVLALALAASGRQRSPARPGP